MELALRGSQVRCIKNFSWSRLMYRIEGNPLSEWLRMDGKMADKSERDQMRELAGKYAHIKAYGSQEPRDPAEVQETRRKLVYIIDSIVGGFDSYQGILKWLNMHSTLDEAYKAAEKEREGMIAT